MRELVTLLAVALCFASVLCLDLSAPAVDINIVEKVNNDPKSSWKARINEKFANLTVAEAKKFFGVVNPTVSLKKITFSATPAQILKLLPESYDTDKAYPQCSIEINNQGQCGSSWAFPVVFSAGNRHCIAQAQKGKTVDYHFSTQYVLSCDRDDFCCSGGNLATAFDFIEENGIPTEKCFHYQSSQAECPKCPAQCEDGTPLNLVYPLKPNTTRTFSNVESAMYDIALYGSLATGIKVYQDFTVYAGGVYSHTHGGYMGDHGVRVTGWGVDSASSLPYWIVANSWGTSWGMKGFVWVKKGNNECSIESYMTAASPTDG